MVTCFVPYVLHLNMRVLISCIGFLRYNETQKCNYNHILACIIHHISLENCIVFSNIQHFTNRDQFTEFQNTVCRANNKEFSILLEPLN